MPRLTLKRLLFMALTALACLTEANVAHAFQPLCPIPLLPSNIPCTSCHGTNVPSKVNYNGSCGASGSVTGFHFFDDFNRPNSSTVGNGWITLAGSSADPQIQNNEVIFTSWAGGIYRPAPFTNPITVSATLKEMNGYGGLLHRYWASLCAFNDGVLGHGYCVRFYRGDQNYANSDVTLFDGAQQIGNIPSSFQYGAQIQVSVTFAPDGSVSGTASDGTNTFNFSFWPRTVQSSGTNVAYHTVGPDTRTSVFAYPRMDDITISLGTGYSNVLFLPGLEASRLYWRDPTCIMIQCENQLWEPNRNLDVKQLYLDANGNSIKPFIYTRDIVDTAYHLSHTYNIYQSFIDHLAHT